MTRTARYDKQNTRTADTIPPGESEVHLTVVSKKSWTSIAASSALSIDPYEVQ